MSFLALKMVSSTKKHNKTMPADQMSRAAGDWFWYFKSISNALNLKCQLEVSFDQAYFCINYRSQILYDYNVLKK